MSHARLHLKNATALIFSGAMAKILIFLAMVRIFKDKNISVEDNGVFQLALTFGFIFSLVTEAGVRGYLVRELARARQDVQRSRELFGNVINARILLILVVTPVSFAILSAGHYDSKVIVFSSWFLLYALCDSFALLFKFVLRAYERMEFDAVFSVIGRGIILVMIMYFGHSGRLTLATVTISHISGTMIELAGLTIAMEKLLPLRILYPLHWGGIKEALVRSLPFAVVNIVGILYLRTGTIALSKMMGEEAVGYFNTASKFPEAACFFPIAVVNALIPFLSRKHEDTPTIRRYFNFLLRYIGFVGIAVSVLFVFDTKWVILAMAKKEYLVEATTFRLFGLWVLLVFIQYALANFLICLNEEHVVMKGYCMALCVNIVLNLTFIHFWGISGAAAALCLSELFSTAFVAVMLHRRGIVIPLSIVLQVLAAGGIAAFVLVILQQNSAMVRLPLAAVAGSAVVLLVAWKQDRHLIPKLLHRQTTAEQDL